MECRYKVGTYDIECIKCENDYYLSNEKCYECYYKSKSITGGTFYDYYFPGGDHNKNNYCDCDYNYVKNQDASFLA